MSCYEWERGEITLPAKEWASFRKSLLKAWNDKQLEVLDVAKRAHAAAQLAAKGKKGKNRQPLVLAAIAKECGGQVSERGDFFTPGYHLNVEAHELWSAVTRMILTGQAWKGEATNTKNPQKKSLDLKALSKDCTINLSDASITFRNKSRTVYWDVRENNHARDHAHEHWFAKRLFNALGRVSWTPRTGGVLVGNDEYNRDADHAGGGGNYITHSYGGIGKRESKYARGF